MNKRLQLFLTYLIINGEVANKKEFSERIDKKPTYLSGMLSGVKTITKATVDKICQEFPELNPDWLLGGVGNMTIDHQATGSINNYVARHDNIVGNTGNVVTGGEKADDLRREIEELKLKLEEKDRAIYELLDTIRFLKDTRK